MNTDKRKQLRSDYKAKPATGGVYAIDCGGDNSRTIKSSVDMPGLQNRFQFALNTNTCPDPTLREKWERYGTKAFSLVVLEELVMKQEQTAADFRDELKLLYSMWLDKLACDGRE